MQSISSEEADMLKPYREELCEWINGVVSVPSFSCIVPTS